MSEIRGKHRITKGLGTLSRTFDDRVQVLSYDNYFKAYQATQLPLLTSKRNLHKVYCLDEEKGFYLCYALRVALHTLKSLRTVDSDEDVALITVNFSESFTERLEQMKSPVSYYGKRLKSYFDKFGITDFMYVLEQGARRKNQTKRRLHAHILCVLSKVQIDLITVALSDPNEVLVEKSGKIERRAISIDLGYTVKKYRKYMQPDEIEMLELEIKDYPDSTAWRVPNTFDRVNGVVFEKKISGIDVGLADYLSKQLNQRLLKGSVTNYYMSQSLRRKINFYAERIIDSNKIAMGIKSKS